MGRSIVLPLYDHTSEDEIAEIMSELSRMGLDNAIVVHAFAPEAEVELDVPGIPSERADVGALRRGAHLLRKAGGTIYANELDALRWAILSRLTSGAPASPSSAAELVHDRPLAMAAIDQEGSRVDRELHSVRVEEREDPDRVVRLQALPAAVDRVFRAVELDRAQRVELVRPPSFRDHAEEIGYHRSIEILRLASEPIDGRPGWRVAKDGREWYAEEWL